MPGALWRRLLNAAKVRDKPDKRLVRRRAALLAPPLHVLRLDPGSRRPVRLGAPPTLAALDGDPGLDGLAAEEDVEPVLLTLIQLAYPVDHVASVVAPPPDPHELLAPQATGTIRHNAEADALCGCRVVRGWAQGVIDGGEAMAVFSQLRGCGRWGRDWNREHALCRQGIFQRAHRPQGTHARAAGVGLGGRWVDRSRAWAGDTRAVFAAGGGSAGGGGRTGSGTGTGSGSVSRTLCPARPVPLRLGHRALPDGSALAAAGRDAGDSAGFHTAPDAGKWCTSWSTTTTAAAAAADTADFLAVGGILWIKWIGTGGEGCVLCGRVLCVFGL